MPYDNRFILDNINPGDFLVFLDLDEVVNSHMPNVQPALLSDKCHWYDPKCTHFLNKALLHLNAKIVITSTWRITKTLHELSILLSEMGLPGDNVVGATTTEHLDIAYYIESKTDSCRLPRSRGLQISSWLKELNQVHDYLVIDDSIDARYGHVDKYHPVDSMTGFTCSDLEAILKRF